MNILQQADIIEDEEDFLILMEEDLVASQKENRNSCYGKLVEDREYNI